MSVIFLIFLVAGCYTFTTLNDKHAVAKEGISSAMFTFLMCASMAVFLIPCLYFVEVRFDFSPAAFAGVLLMTLCKFIELYMSAVIFRVMSAFELKAWVGTTLFASYATDVYCGTAFRVQSLLFILLTVIGLALIVRSDKRERVPYKKILLPLILYLGSKYGYGLVIKAFAPHASSSVLLLVSLTILSLLLLPTVKPGEMREKKKGTLMVVSARIPNTVGMLAENRVALMSLTSYSFIQPMILCALFVIRMIRREDVSKVNILGSLLAVIGLIGFQLFK